MRRKFRDKKEQEKSTNSNVSDSNVSMIAKVEDTHTDFKPVKSGDSSTVSLSDVSYSYEKGDNTVSFLCSAINNTSDDLTGLLSLYCWISEKPRENGDWQNDSYTIVDSIELCSLKKGYSLSNINQTFEIPDNLLEIIDNMNEEDDEWHFVFTINELHEDGNNYIIHTVNCPNENEGIKLPIQDASLTIFTDEDNKIMAFVDGEEFSGTLVSSDERFEMDLKESKAVSVWCYHKNGEIAVCGSMEDSDSSCFYYDENGDPIEEDIFKSRYGSDFERVIDLGFDEIKSKAVDTDDETSYERCPSVFSIVKSIVIDKLGVEPYEVVESASFINDLGADSLDAVELIMEFEKEFGISIPDDEAERLRTIGDAVRYIETHR